MNKLFYPKQITKSLWSRLHRSTWMSLVILVSSCFTSMELSSQCLTVSKELLGVAAASSGIAGNIDATYRITVINPSIGGCGGVVSGISVNDQLNSATNLGSAFVRVVGLPIVSLHGLTSIITTMNPSYDGATNTNLTNGDGFLMQDDTLIYQLTAELNPRISTAPSILNNRAIVSHLVPVSSPSVTSNSAVIPNCWTNCQMACNNSVTVSVNTMCEADVLADMVLEGDYADCASLGFYSVTISYNGVVLSLPLGKAYLNKKLVVSIKNIVCGNSCWGNLILEDKIPPALICKPRDTFRCNVNLNPSVFGFPVNPALVNQTVYPYVVTGIDACGSVTLTYKDSVVNHPCSDTLSSTVYRRWCAKDNNGFTACCTDTIDIVRGTLADLTLPPHYDGQPGNQPALRCNGNWTKLPNGNPDTTTTGTGRPQGLLCGNIQFDYTDDTLRVCDGTFKLLRRWLIIDWCKPNSRITYIQLIKVVDDVRPVVICPTTMTINTAPNVCTGSIILPVPQNLTPTTVIDNKIPYVIESCSRWTYSVTHRPATSPTNCTPDPTKRGTTQNITKLPNGQYRVDNMPFGCNWIYYTICDDCGNCTECTFDIEVKDLTPPTAICQQRTVVSLTENGQATIQASVFDDHSWDNCEIAGFLVRRMNPGACGSTSFAPTQTFCCGDIASNPIRVVLQVSDKSGNVSECMIDVIVQDKLPPRITCPRDTIINCETNISNLTIFGNATASDNCSFTLTNRIENNLNACNLGTIRRWFVVTDAGGRKDSCSQLITIIDVNPFKASDITWPRDTNITGCRNNTGVDITGKPQFINTDKCNSIITNYDDLVFNYVEGVCYKILRRWTVIDWCTYDVNNPTKGAWYHTQVIKVVNNEKPTITSSCAARELCITDNCSVSTVLSASAIDDCTAQDELIWSYSLDKGNNGSVDVTGSSRTFNTTFNAGVHKITWVVSDQCGNSSSCTYLITVKDCKAPTPYCNPGIITVIMPSSKQVTIWAKDFNLASSDNCTEASLLKYSFSAALKDSFKTITCADLENGRADTIKVDIYVTDLDGNQDLCHTTLIVQDNSDVCPNKFTNTANISGLITGIDKNVMASNVPVQFYEMNSGVMSENATDNSGKYAFPDILKHQPYMIKPILNEDQLRGVSTRDIVAIQKHILGKEIITNPYYLIAADVNKSNSITSRDIADLRKIILGVVNEFPNNNPSWNFVDANNKLTVDEFYKFNSTINLNDLNGSTLENNFIAIKTGDVTGEATTGGIKSSQTRSNSIAGVEVSQVKLNEGKEYEIGFKISNSLEVEGIQFELRIDAELASITGISSDILDIQNFNYNILDKGQLIRFSWNSNRNLTVSQGAELFKLIVRANKTSTINAQSLQFEKSTMTSQIYTESEDLNLKLLFRNNDSNLGLDAYELYQNVPNPFTGLTTVFFKVPNDQNVLLKIYDMSGKQIKLLNVFAKKGLNATEIELQNENAGVLYYQLDAKDFIATRKMVIIR